MNGITQTTSITTDSAVFKGASNTSGGSNACRSERERQEKWWAV